ncbi:toucan isoform 2-T5 [Glossina fuscipes fuscipes]
MATKETTTNARLLTTGLSRIPLAGTTRCPVSVSASVKTSQILRPSVSLVKSRPPTYSTLRSSSQPSSLGVRKCSSGDRISNVNIMGRKTTTVLKKFLSKPEKISTQIPKAPGKRLFNSKQTNDQIPNTLTRSDTFTCSNTKLDIFSAAKADILVQSTPLPVTGKVAKKSQQLCENTRSLDTTTVITKSEEGLSTMQSLDFTYVTNRVSNIAENQNLENQRQLHNACGYKADAESTQSNVIDEQPVDMKADNVNITHIINSTQIMDRTLCFISPKENKSNRGDLTQILKSPFYSDANVKKMESNELISPATNATFSNPGSTENVMLEDVSVPPGFEEDTLVEMVSDGDADVTLIPTASEKANMKLPLNSTRNTERLLDISQVYSPPKPIQSLSRANNECIESPYSARQNNNSKLLYMSQVSASATTTPDRNGKKFGQVVSKDYQSGRMHPPLLLKAAQSDLALPVCTPDEDIDQEPMDVDSTLIAMGHRTEEFLAQNQAKESASSLQDVSNTNEKPKSRFSFGLDLTESTLDCSIELVDVSLSSTVLSQPGNANLGPHNNLTHSNSSQYLHQDSQMLRRQNSFDMDESLGILTPDQMKEFLDSSAANTNTNNLDLPMVFNSCHNANKLALHQMRIDQTPSPEDLPLDPVEVKTDIDMILIQQQRLQHQQQLNRDAYNSGQQQQQQETQSNSICTESISLHTDTEPSKTDPMTKSGVSKISTSFITSVTSVTSLDTGYQGDGEMSRPASRGACDHSPSNGPVRKGVSRQPSFNQQQLGHLPPVRRQDPMTDSDFFTESDADDIFNRGDRRAQVIDGQLYGPMLQPATSVFISEDPQMEDSCMESSGIFTDVENRCDEDLTQMRRQEPQTSDNLDLSPDADGDGGDDSTETVRSNRENIKRSCRLSQESDRATTIVCSAHATSTGHCQGHLSGGSQTSSTIQSSMSTDRLSAATLSNRTSYCSVDGSGCNVDFKSFSSLDEAFNAENDNENEVNVKHLHTKLSKSSTTSTTSWCEQTMHKNLPAVQRVTSPRKHASLSSLYTENGVSGAKPSSTTATTKAITATTIENAITPIYVNVNSVGQSETGSLRSGASGAGSKSSLNETQNSGKSNSNTLSGKQHSPRTKTVTKSVKNRAPYISANNNTGKINSPPVVRKHHSSNKWEAVMNQIANNKAIMKTNYSNVKSKVSTRLNMGAEAGYTSPAQSSPTVRRSPTSLGNVNRHLSPNANRKATNKINTKDVNVKVNKLAEGNDNKTKVQQQQTNKRLFQGTINKRGRSYSKDSQKSSQSDLSLNSAGSPKLLAKTPLQKRYGSSGQTAATQSSTSTTISSPTSGNSVVSVKSATASNQKFMTASPATGKLPLKDHNRILNQTIAQPTNSTTSVISTTIKNASKIEPTTSEIKEIGSSSAVVNNFLPDKSDENKRVRSRTSSPLPNNSKFTATSDKKNKQQHHVHASSSFRTLPLHRLSEDELTLTTYEKEEAEKATPSYNNSLKYQRLETLFREQSQQQNRSIEALAVLLQYLVYDLDAFACPTVKVQNVTAQEKLRKTLILLEETKSACSELQDQLCDKEAYYAQRENELHALHRCELEKTSLQLSEFQLLAKQQISELENQLNAKETEYKRTLDCYRLEMENKLSQKKEQLKAAEDRERSLHQRLTAVERSEQELHQQITNVQTTCAGRIQMAAEREQQVNERIKLLSKELDQLRAIKENNERELKDKLNLSQDELAVLRTSRRSLNESAVNNSPRNSSSIANMEISRLQSEAESLRCVLELKQKEISKLTKQNEELLRDAEERSSLQNKISLLESKNEMLQSELEIKSDKEKDFLRQMDEIQKAFNHETVKRTRLSYDNEALQWQLKQRSEQLHIVEAKLAELSASNEMMNSSSLGLINRSMLNGSSVTNSTHVEDVSPPSSPVVKGVIEKTDSVSWVLEMDDETPEVAASKLVKRAGSFRSVERSPSTRRQLSVSANAAMCNSNALNNSNNSMIGAGPHPLSQSMSATSVIREHSKEATNEFINRAQSRIRSKSVSVKGTETGQKSTKKLIRQHSGGNNRKIELTANVWKESLVTSSPYTVRPRSSNFKRESSSEHGDQEILFRRSSPSSKLITCDTSSLNSGERLEMRSLPSHPSVHDLKGNKKCQEIQESAGEAMVSGTNSEDESCSASSDDMASSVSTSSAAASDSTSSSSSNQIKNPHISLEEVLLIKKINNLSATPMEVSWSEEGDTFANSSTL